MNGMGIGMRDGPSPSPSPSGFFPRRHRRMMMHMTFFWGRNSEVLFDGWPGTDVRMYYLSLVFVFLLAVLSEWLSHCRLIKPGPASLGSGLIQTLVYTVRTGISYLVMLAVMSFNGGVFLAAVAGFGLGFLVFGSRVFRNTDCGNNAELPSHC